MFHVNFLPKNSCTRNKGGSMKTKVLFIPKISNLEKGKGKREHFTNLLDSVKRKIYKLNFRLP